MKLSLRHLLSAAVALFGLGLAAPAIAQSVPQGDGGVIRMMASPYGSQSFIPFVMEKYHLDTKYGFKLQKIPYSDPKAVNAAIQGGSAEMAVFDWNQIALMRNAGVKVIGVTPFLTYVSSIVVPVDSPIKGVADIASHKLGVFSLTSVDWILVEAAARKAHGIDLTKTAELQEAAPTLLRGALEQGHLDATIMFSSIAPDMLAGGKFKNVFTVRDMVKELGLPVSPYLIVATTEDYAKSHPDNVKAFAAAYREVVDILKKDDSVWTEQGKNMKLSDAALVIYRDEIRADILTSFAPDTNDVLHKTFDILKETAGAKALGMEKMPDEIVSVKYQ